MNSTIEKRMTELLDEAARHRENGNNILELRSLQKLQAYAIVAIANELKRMNNEGIGIQQ